MEFIGFNLQEEDFKEDLTKIGKFALPIIRYEIINGKIISNPSKGKKRGMGQQNLEAPMNLEYFEYDIPEIVSVEDLLEEIIKRLKRTNEKINFIKFHFCQDLRHISS